MCKGPTGLVKNSTWQWQPCNVKCLQLARVTLTILPSIIWWFRRLPASSSVTAEPSAASKAQKASWVYPRPSSRYVHLYFHQKTLDIRSIYKWYQVIKSLKSRQTMAQNVKNVVFSPFFFHFSTHFFQTNRSSQDIKKGSTARMIQAFEAHNKKERPHGRAAMPWGGVGVGIPHTCRGGRLFGERPVGRRKILWFMMIYDDLWWWHMFIDQ